MQSPLSSNILPIARQGGFTLLEIMVVVALIALMSVSILLTIPSDGSSNAHLAQKKKLATILRNLSQTAILEQRWYGLHFKDKSYQAVYFSNKQWVAKPESNPIAIAKDVAFELTIDNQQVSTQSNADNTAQSSLITDSTLIDSTAVKPENYLPQITISPTGLFNQFELRFGDEQLEESVLSDPYAQI